MSGLQAPSITVLSLHLMFEPTTLHDFRCSLTTSTRDGQQGLRERPFPRDAQVVICGGGVVGTSVAYHLPKYGFNDVILLEQGR